MPDPTGRISHIDEMHRGQTWKRYCRVATTANVTIATDLNAGDVIDGVTLAAGDRVFVKSQTAGAENGIYLAGVTPIRDYDMDQDASSSVPASEVLGAVIHVIAGTVNGGTLWRCTNATAPTLGTTALTFTQIVSTSSSTSSGMGPPGYDGSDGDEGPMGPPGLRGAAGATGAAGADGTPGGPVGPAGPAGPPGEQGEDGPMGPPGLPGAAGSGGGSSDPSSIGGLYNWFAADAITGLSNGGSVVEWRNAASRTPGNDLITASGTPTYQTNVVNSLPVVRLGGSAYLKFLATALQNASYTFVIVCKFSSLANAYTGILGYNVGADSGGYFVKSNGTTAHYPPNSTSYDGTGAATIDTTAWNYLVLNVKGLTYDTRKNGAADKTGTSFSWNASINSAFIGNQFVGSRVMSGDIAEILIYARSLSSSETTSIESYITGKYAI